MYCAWWLGILLDLMHHYPVYVDASELYFRCIEKGKEDPFSPSLTTTTLEYAR